MLTRRTLLLGGLRATALLPALPYLQAAPLRLRATDEEAQARVLVVLQLSGGNDGLNTVIPWSQEDYWRMRPNLGQKRNLMHRLDDQHALHPAMRGLAELYASQQVAVYHGIGLPQPNRSHFRAMDVWHTASLQTRLPAVGWLGQLADSLAAQNPGTLPALAIGGGELPYSLRADRTQASAIRDENSLRIDARTRSIRSLRAGLLEVPRDGDLAYLANTARASYATAERLESLAKEASPTAYPGTPLARGFALVAQFIAAGLGCRVYHLELGGFDTHARQNPLHTDRLSQVSGALSAFQADLAQRGIAKNVRTLVFSEFGRRAHENGSKGTDHGHGAPAFVVGAGVKAGLHGHRPDLAKLVDGDVPVTTDFRALYAALESDWMGAPTAWKQARVAL